MKRGAKGACRTVLTLGLGVMPPPATDWPQLWGPRVTAAVEAPASGPLALRPLWRRPVGSGFSGIVVEGDAGYTAESDGTTDHALAFDVKTGRTLWRAPLGPTYRGHDGSRDGPIATPAVVGGRVFMAAPRGTLHGLDARSGRELWRHDLVADHGAAVPFYGFGASPVVAGGRVVVQTGGKETSGLLAFDAESGRRLWSALPAETKGDSSGYSMAVPADLFGVPQLLAMGHDRIFAVAPEDGRILWSHAFAEPEEPTRAPLVIGEGRVIVSRYRDTALLQLSREGGAIRVAEAWRTPRLKNSYSPNVHGDGFVFGYSGQYLLCVDAASGELRWRQKVNAGTLIRVGGHLLLLGEQSGLLRVVEASPSGYRPTAEASVFNAGAQASTGPTYAGGRVFVRNVEEMVALALEPAPAVAEAGKVNP